MNNIKQSMMIMMMIIILSNNNTNKLILKIGVLQDTLIWKCSL